jgi:hypothetical protein
MSIRRGPFKPSFINTYSLDFDGMDDYLNIANNTTIGRTQNISYSAWVNLTSTTARQYIIGNWGSSNYGTGLALENIGGNALVFQIGDGTNDSFFNSRVSNFSTLVSPNTWAHILATWDGTDAKIYINGNLENTWSPTTPYTIVVSNPFHIGWRGIFSNMTNGMLDELSLFDTAISIGDVWNGSGKPTDLSDLSPTTWYRMGEKATYDGTNWTLVDQGSEGNNATSVNMDLIDRVPDTPPS